MTSAVRWIARPVGLAGVAAKTAVVGSTSTISTRRPGVGPVRSAAVCDAAPCSSRDTDATVRDGIISVSLRTTGSCTTTPAGTTTNQRRESWCHRIGSRNRPKPASTVAATAGSHAAAAHASWGHDQRRRGDQPRRRAREGISDRRAQAEALLVAVRRCLDVHATELGRSDEGGRDRRRDHQLDRRAGVGAACDRGAGDHHRAGDHGAGERERGHSRHGQRRRADGPPGPRADRPGQLNGTTPAVQRVADRGAADCGDDDPRHAGDPDHCGRERHATTPRGRGHDRSGHGARLYGPGVEFPDPTWTGRFGQTAGRNTPIRCGGARKGDRVAPE